MVPEKDTLSEYRHANLDALTTYLQKPLPLGLRSKTFGLSISSTRILSADEIAVSSQPHYHPPNSPHYPLLASSSININKLIKPHQINSIRFTIIFFNFLRFAIEDLTYSTVDLVNRFKRDEDLGDSRCILFPKITILLTTLGIIPIGTVHQQGMKVYCIEIATRLASTGQTVSHRHDEITSIVHMSTQPPKP